MNEKFDDSEFLLRAVLPANRKPYFWKQNGKLSSAALKDKNGLSVDRTYDRTIEDAAATTRLNLHGTIASISVPSCNEVHAFLSYCPSARNRYHSEIHGSKTKILLSDEQAFLLAQKAILLKEDV